MSTLNKLLNLLDELKEENPELANKALLAAETLKAGADLDDLEDLEDEDEEEFDDSYVEITREDTVSFFKLRELLNNKISEFGVYMRDHEVQKNLLLEDIEKLRSNNEEIVEVLREKYKLDPESEYTMEINEDGSGNIVFVKQ
jgi:hypothetical protein|tara:strand:- start:1478 stop:1906 length:429 start_codon:yes stop_codon:yes gene_type:complete